MLSPANQLHVNARTAAMPTSTLPPLAAIRAHFPALASPRVPPSGGPTILLDNAGGSQVPVGVADAIRRYMLNDYVQLGAGYDVSVRATKNVDDAHAFINTVMNGDRSGATLLGPSTTQLCHMLAGCYRRHLRPGDEIIVAECGHESNIGAWLALTEIGVRIRWWNVGDDPSGCPLDALDELLGPRTRLVCFTHVSNLLGGIVDVAEVARRAHSVGARVVVDGVAYAAHRAIDVDAWGCDWYVYSTYKVYGPHMAALFGRHEAIDELTGPNHFFIPRDRIPYKFELGGASHEGCAGLVALRSYLAFLAGGDSQQPAPTTASTTADDRAIIERAFEVMTELELPLQRRLIEGLSALPGVRLLGPTTFGPERVATVSFVHDRVPAASIAAAAHARGVGFRNGHMYAYRLCEALGVDLADGVVRISAVHYNSIEEIDRAVEAVRAAITRS